jgi:hypothetical protein
MAGDLHDHCPPVGDKKLAQIIDRSGVKDKLKTLGVADLLDQTNNALTEMKSTGASDDEVVNAMTEAYCPIALANTTVPRSERIALLGSFSDIVYEEVKNLDTKKTVNQKTDTKSGKPNSVQPTAPAQ